MSELAKALVREMREEGAGVLLNNRTLPSRGLTKWRRW